MLDRLVAVVEAVGRNVILQHLHVWILFPAIYHKPPDHLVREFGHRRDRSLRIFRELIE